MENYLTYQEIAIQLNIPLRSLYQYNKDGKGPKTTKIGRHLRVSVSDLEAWLKDQTE